MCLMYIRTQGSRPPPRFGTTTSSPRFLVVIEGDRGTFTTTRFIVGPIAIRLRVHCDGEASFTTSTPKCAFFFSTRLNLPSPLPSCIILMDLFDKIGVPKRLEVGELSSPTCFSAPSINPCATVFCFNETQV